MIPRRRRIQMQRSKKLFRRGSPPQTKAKERSCIVHGRSATAVLINETECAKGKVEYAWDSVLRPPAIICQG